jgi:hypothetical protein
MSTQKAEAVAQHLGTIQSNDQKLQVEIDRLNCKSFVSLEQVEKLHNWLEESVKPVSPAGLLGNLEQENASV